MSIFKLSPKTNTFITSTIENNKCRSLASSIAVAMVLSEGLPADCVENEAMANGFILDKLETINKYVPVDINAVREITRRLFLWRCAVSKPGQLNGIVQKDTGLVDLLGLSRHFDAATLLAMHQDAVAISHYKLGYADLLCEACEQENA